HHFDDVGSVLGVEVERRLDMFFRRLQPEVMPEGERRPVDILSVQRAVDPLFAAKRFRAGGDRRRGPSYEFTSAHFDRSPQPFANYTWQPFRITSRASRRTARCGVPMRS